MRFGLGYNAAIARPTGCVSNAGSALRAASVGTAENLARCTYAEPEQFYSYRRSTHRAERDYGRHVNAIVLAG